VPFNILLLPLLGGFVFVSLWNRTYWHTQRAEKERLLLYASCAGILFLGIAILIGSVPAIIPCLTFRVPVPFSVAGVPVPCLPTWWHEHVPFRYSGISTIALIIGVTAWWPLNRWLYDERTEWARLIRDRGGPLEKRLYQAMVDDKWVMVSLKGGKVYIGLVGAGFTPEKDKTIFLVPFRSGYRDPVKQWVNITTDYENVYERIKQDNPTTYGEIISDFGVVIPVEEVLTATLYRPDIHEKYFALSPNVCLHCLPTIWPVEPAPAVAVPPDTPEKLEPEGEGQQ
jgi:hypothetical protein